MTFKVLSIWCNTPIETLKQFLNLLILMAFSASAIFSFTFPTSAKHLPLRTFSIQGNNKKVTQGENRWIGRVGHVRRCACKSPIMKWANALKESSKQNSLKLNVASHNNVSWCTDTDGFLEHSPSRGSLYYKGPAHQKIILFFLGGAPLWYIQ